MLVLGSCGFGYTENRLKLSQFIGNKSGKMLIIPLACMCEKETGEKEKNYVSSIGMKKENIFVFDSEKPEEFMDMDFDYITVLGGNTFKLLHLVKKFHLDTFIKKQVSEGAIYFGFSAGSYLACPDIEYVKNFDDNNDIEDNDFSALGMTEKYVLCHFNTRGTKEIMMCREYIGKEPELLTINDNQFIVIL